MINRNNPYQISEGRIDIDIQRAIETNTIDLIAGLANLAVSKRKQTEFINYSAFVEAIKNCKSNHLSIFVDGKIVIKEGATS